MGILGLVMLSNLIPGLASMILGMELNSVKSRNFGLTKILFTMVSIVVFEELFFRRLVAQRLKNISGFRKAVWLSALIFSLAHVYTETGLLSAFVGGVIFTIIYLKIGSILISIVSHLTYNLLTYFLVAPTLDYFDLRNENSYPLVIGLIGMGSALISGMFFALKKKRKAK